MIETPNLGLPLVAAAQAQKHVTVNEALLRLDALAAAVRSRTQSAPPPTPAEGDAYIVPAGAEAAWDAVADTISAFVGGGWLAIAPTVGKRVWVIDEAGPMVFDGAGWTAGEGPAAFGAGAGFGLRVVEVAPLPGETTTLTPPVIEDKWIVYGVTGRVIMPLTGEGVTGWRLGVADGADRYGAGYGLEAGSTVHGVTAQPIAYYGQTPLQLQSIGGAFGGGVVRLCVHYVALSPPRA